MCVKANLWGKYLDIIDEVAEESRKFCDYEFIIETPRGVGV
jgi:hypothetical protein